MTLERLLALMLVSCSMAQPVPPPLSNAQSLIGDDAAAAASRSAAAAFASEGAMHAAGGGLGGDTTREGAVGRHRADLVENCTWLVDGHLYDLRAMAGRYTLRQGDSDRYTLRYGASAAACC